MFLKNKITFGELTRDCAELFLAAILPERDHNDDPALCVSRLRGLVEASSHQVAELIAAERMLEFTYCSGTEQAPS